MIDLSFGLFGKRLNQVVNDITPTSREYQLAAGQIELFNQHILGMHQQNQLPPLAAPYTTVVGSYFKETAIRPIHHIDLFLLLDASFLEISAKNLTVKVLHSHPLLATTTNPSQLIMPSLLLSQLSTQFSSAFEVSISRSQQTIHLKSPSYILEFRITPAIQFPDFYFIPEEKTELTWKKVHPLREKQLLQALNTKQNNMLPQVVKIIKYWNEQKNNNAFRNPHLEAIAHFVYADVSTPPVDLYSALKIYVEKLSKFLYNTPDPTGLSTPVHTYLPDTIDRWYLYMNRVETLKNEVLKGEKSFVKYLLNTEQESTESTAQ